MDASSHTIQLSIQYASLALLYYDYALTFSYEVRYIWGEKIRLSTFLYIFCRYALIANLVYLLAFINQINLRFRLTSPYSCDTGYKISGALSVLGRSSIMLVWGIRTYAVFDRNRFIMALMSALGLTCIVLDIVLRVHLQNLHPRFNHTSAGGLLAIMMCCFESSSTALTTVRCIQALRVGGPMRTQRSGLAYLVLEQAGTLIYFENSVVSGFSIASMVLIFPGEFLRRLLNGITLPLSGMLTARFLLHLRRWESRRLNAEVELSRISITPRSRISFHRSHIEDFGEDPVARARRDSILVIEIV
ncbi:hypothetical protein BDQ12DRAFT_688836 [Crucibulum laeve]|uniref:DUF6533 domain-containing protein n=1 Tax=Crucibulum laeve TaxID=68775 RepID=A0A5C3LQV6_9AGAR|nr:hypothetical protein BDQ12DRAFT_688836 [Crucibulum laeve]